MLQPRMNAYCLVIFQLATRYTVRYTSVLSIVNLEGANFRGTSRVVDEAATGALANADG